MTRNSHEELPPAYEETLSHPPRPASPPHSATRAVAPLTISETNMAIKGTYAVRLTASKAGPDVKVSSTNGALGLSLWLQGSLDRPAEVDVSSSNGRVNLTVQREAGTAIDVNTKSSNGAIILRVPEDFDGLVTLRSTNGKKGLGHPMEGVIFPSEGDYKSITYRVRPRSHTHPKPLPGGDKDVMDKETQEYARLQAACPEDELDPADKGPDRATASTTNGSVRVQYVGTDDESSGSTCCIM